MLVFLATFALFSEAFARENFIIDGHNVNITDFPWTGSMKSSAGVHSCGCVFIGGEYAVTTKLQCALDPDSYYLEFGGTVHGTGSIFQMLWLRKYPQNAPAYGNNIALIRATEEISGPNIAPAVMTTFTGNPGGIGWITGWGSVLTAGDRGPPHLQGLQIPLIDDGLCSSASSGWFDASNQICAWDQENVDAGMCTFDSGGPFTIGNTLFGIMSHTIGNCYGYPTIMTKVGVFHEWVCSRASEGSRPIGC